MLRMIFRLSEMILVVLLCQVLVADLQDYIPVPVMDTINTASM